MYPLYSSGQPQQGKQANSEVIFTVFVGSKVLEAIAGGTLIYPNHQVDTALWVVELLP